MLLSLTGEAHDNVPCDSSIGHQLPKPEQTKDEGERSNESPQHQHPCLDTLTPTYASSTYTIYSRIPKTRKKTRMIMFPSLSKPKPSNTCLPSRGRGALQFPLTPYKPHTKRSHATGLFQRNVRHGQSVCINLDFTEGRSVARYPGASSASMNRTEFPSYFKTRKNNR